MVFGDGRLPEVLLDCMQFRLVADLAVRGRAEESHLAQLSRHLEVTRCRGCRGYLQGRVAERFPG